MFNAKITKCIFSSFKLVFSLLQVDTTYIDKVTQTFQILT